MRYSVIAVVMMEYFLSFFFFPPPVPVMMEEAMEYLEKRRVCIYFTCRLVYHVFDDIAYTTVYLRIVIIIFHLSIHTCTRNSKSTIQ